MKSSSTSFAVLALTLAAGLSASGSASAVYRNTSAGGACQPAAGSSTASFNHSNNYLTNIGTTSQFVICHFAMDDSSATPTPISYLAVSTQSTQAGSRIVSCSAQTGGFYYGVNNIKSNSVQTHTYTAPGYMGLYWTTSGMTRTFPYDTFTLNCRLDPGTRIGLIEAQF